MKETDLDLLQRFTQARDADAFSQIVGRYQDFVYSTCVRVLDDPAGAEDAAQECFLRLLQKGNTVRSSLAGWLHRCATNMSIDEMRGRALRKSCEEATAKMNAASGNDLTWHELAPHVDKALNELPDDLRIVIVEHFLRSRAQSEIANELGVSAMTVSRRVESGIEELRKKFKKAGVIVSAALLASLISENAVQAAPAALSAALSKMSVLAATKSGGVVSSAGWVGVGTPSKVGTGTTKMKLLVGALAAVAVGIGALHLATRGNGQPAAPAEQQQPAAVADDKPEEKPAAPQLDPLLAAIPADAVAFVWAPKLRQLLDGTGSLLPPVKMFLDDAVANNLPQLGLTDEVLDGPAAMVVVPPEMPDGLAQMAILLTVPDMEALKDKMDGPDADGMYGRGVEPSSNIPGYDICMMPYKGFAAFSEPAPYSGSPSPAVLVNKEDLAALAAAGQRTYEPSAEALRLINDAEVFVHIDAPTVPKMMDLEMRRKYEGNIGVLPIWALPVREAKSIDLALSFDDAGTTVQAAIAFDDDSKIAEYLAPAPGLDKVEPRLPFLQDYALAAWVKSDKRVAVRLMGDLAAGVERVMFKQAADQPEEVTALTKGCRTIVAAHRDIAGEGFGIALQVRRLVHGLGVLDLAEPQEFKPRVQRQLEAVNKQIAEELGAAGRFEYQPNAKVVSSDDGLIAAQIDRIRYPGRISMPLSIIGGKLVLASGSENIRKALHTLEGRDDVPVLAEHPPAKEMLEKIGLGHNVIIVFDLTPVLEEFVGPNPRAGELASAPAAIGLKAEEGNVLRIKAYLSKGILTLMVRAALQHQSLQPRR